MKQTKKQTVATGEVIFVERRSLHGRKYPPLISGSAEGYRAVMRDKCAVEQCYWNEYNEAMENLPNEIASLRWYQFVKRLRLREQLRSLERTLLENLARTDIDLILQKNGFTYCGMQRELVVDLSANDRLTEIWKRA